MLATLAAVSAALLGGLAIAYARFVWTHGNGFRRFMRWLAPLWSLVSFWYASIWVYDALHPDFDSTPWLRPVAWAVFLIPSLILFNSLKEDTRRKAEHNHDAALVEAKRREIEHD
jgi:hypothetical protein